MERRDVREVELVEPDERQARTASSRSRWRRWWPVPVMVVALVVGAQVTLDARARAHDARIAALPGTLVPVAARLAVRWQATPADQRILSAGYEFGGAFVGARRMADGSYDALALDVGTGEPRWTVALQAASDARAVDTDPTCVPGPRPGRPSRPSSAGAEARTSEGALVCLVPVSGDAARVVTLDAGDGSVLARADVVGADALAVDGGTTVLLANGGDGSCRLTAVVGGTVRWGAAAACAPGAALLAAGGLVAVGSPESSTSVLDADGQVIDTVEDATLERVGDLLVATTTANGAATSRLFRAGRAPVDVAGTVMVPQVDDGSAAGVVVTADREARGYDATTGRLLWRVPLALSGGYLLRDGKVVSSSSEDLVVAIDARRGTVEHRAAVQRDALAMPPVTDGPTYFTIVLGAPSEPAKLIGIAAEGGPGVTPVGLPVGLLNLRQVGRHLVGSDGMGGVSVLG